MASDAYQDQTERFNWRRTLGLAAAFALHAFAFMMLLAPLPPPAPPPPVVTEQATPMSTPAPPPAPPAPPAPPVDIAPSENISYRRMRPPKYPPQAVREHHTGKVVLKVLIGTDGSPKEVTVEKSSGYRELDQSAVAAAKTWMFNPGRKDGQPYEGYALIPV